MKKRDLIKKSSKVAKLILLWVLGYLGGAGLLPAPTVFLTQAGTVRFLSEAPLEIIRARSEELRGALDSENNTFAFSISMGTFEGFNSPLQEEHFCEKFLECAKYPKATFQGKIIEQVDYAVPGTYQVRAKGDFTIHGISQERIIKSILKVEKDQIDISAAFEVPLADHNIKVPRVVYQNLAEVIRVEVQLSLIPQRD